MLGVRILVIAAAACCCLCGWAAGDKPDAAIDLPLRRVRRIVNSETPVTAGEKKLEFGAAVALETEYRVGRWRTRRVNCAATIISERHVITAAHCVASKNRTLFPRSSWRIHMHGTRRRPGLAARINGWVTKKVIQVGQVLGKDIVSNSAFHAHGRAAYVHPRYHTDDYLTHDLAVLRTSRMLLSNYAMHNRVDLPSADVIESDGPRPGKICQFAGWGCRRHGGVLQKYLMRAEFVILPLSECTRIYAQKPKAWSGVLCAKAANMTLCSGDSGGGLICESDSGVPYLAGVASSSGSGSNSFRLPSNFVRVGAYVDWIREVMRERETGRKTLRIGKLEIDLPKFVTG